MLIVPDKFERALFLVARAWNLSLSPPVSIHCFFLSFIYNLPYILSTYTEQNHPRLIIVIFGIILSAVLKCLLGFKRSVCFSVGTECHTENLQTKRTYNGQPRYVFISCTPSWSLHRFTSSRCCRGFPSLPFLHSWVFKSLTGLSKSRYPWPFGLFWSSASRQS